MDGSRVIVLRMWKEAPLGTFRARILDGAGLPGSQTQSIVVSSVEEALAEMAAILDVFDGRSFSPGWPPPQRPHSAPPP
jgi:hypothetical protein